MQIRFVHFPAAYHACIESNDLVLPIFALLFFESALGSSKYLVFYNYESERSILGSCLIVLMGFQKQFSFCVFAGLKAGIK